MQVLFKALGIQHKLVKVFKVQKSIVCPGINNVIMKNFKIITQNYKTFYAKKTPLKQHPYGKIISRIMKRYIYTIYTMPKSYKKETPLVSACVEVAQIQIFHLRNKF